MRVLKAPSLILREKAVFIDGNKVAHYTNLMQEETKMKNADKKPKDEVPLRKRRGALLVYEKLREDIQWLRIDPGSALDEVALSKTYDVSRTPVREALLLLEREGFVQFLQNRTSIVAPLSLHNQAAFLDTYILLSRGLIRAACMHGGTDRKRLEELLQDYADGLEAGDVERAFRAQLELYRFIARQAQNRFLEKYFLEAQDASVRMKLLYFFPHITTEAKTEAVARLRAVVDAMAAGDHESGDAAVRDAILFEAKVIQSGLAPRFGHTLPIDENGAG
ncbi:GntR family transcriptional regulator [Hoeflea sp. AS60]|uniref:GntR family transcriptional regulator n=1 Tax=Hoeflea sp. AS60 TaxID=3135780 RepID=UPI003170C7AD